MQQAQHLIKVTRVLAVIFLLVIFGYAFILVPFDVFETAGLKTIDIYFRLSHLIKPLPKEINSIVIVAIDDDSLQRVNRKWPWDRDIYAKIIKNIEAAKPRVIGFDIVFIGESVNKANDELFENAVKKADNVVLASYYSDNGDRIIPYAPFAKSAKSYGLINKPRDWDYRVRNTRFFVKSDFDGKEVNDYSFEIKTLCEFYGCPVKDIKFDGKKININDDKSGRAIVSIPVRKNGAAKVNYLAGDKDFKVIPAWKIINGRFDKNELKDKIVLIGQSNEIIHDVYPTPLLDMPGVLINANSILMVLSGTFITTIPNAVNSLILIMFSLLALFSAYKFSPLKGFLYVLLEIGLFLALSAILFYGNYIGDFFNSLILIVVIYLAVIFYKYVCLIIESVTLKQYAITDGLTGLYILRYFSVRVQNELERAKRYGTKLSLVMMDIDHFKLFNDKYGHEDGNLVLKGFAEIMKETFRKTDILARYGGEEFCALLPGVGKNEAFESAERFRKKLRSLPFYVSEGNVTEHVTVSLGVVSYPDTAVDLPKDFVEFADKALYEAKRGGRNKTIYFSGY